MRNEPKNCPICRGAPIEESYYVERAPAHTVVLYSTEQEALEAEQGEILLTACSICGFAYNAVFDPALLSYSENYEATQSYSETFNRFHKELATEIASAALLRAGSVLEVGCGQGEFLALLEEAGCQGGIGFDPAYDPARSALPEDTSCKILACDFDPARVDVDIAAIVCKMTLEHIADPARLIRQMATLSGLNNSCPVFVQVPNASLVFSQTAFWDIYYEHCNYFTSATLSLAFERSGMSVIRKNIVYDGQYIVIQGRADGALRNHKHSPIDKDEALAEFRSFVSRSAKNRNSWSGILNSWSEGGDCLAIWGGGSKAVAFMENGQAVGSVSYAIDINPRKRGTYLPGSGLEVLNPEQLKADPPDRIILLNGKYKDEVSSKCTELGLGAEIIPVDSEILPQCSPRKICVGVITRQRQRMLGNLLSSFERLKTPNGYKLHFVIVENTADPSGSLPQIAGVLKDRVTYDREPRVGIPFARNKVLDLSQKFGCTLTAFIDDDEQADPDWIIELVTAIESGSLDLVGGPVRLLHSGEGHSLWQRLIKRGLSQRLSRRERKAANRVASNAAEEITVVTNNWMIRNEFLQRSGLRFDERLRYTGGSDTAFFHAAKQLDIKSGWAPKAVVFEEYSAGRLTLRYQFSRSMSQSINSFHRKYGDNVNARVILNSTGFVAYKVLVACIHLLAVPVQPGNSLVAVARGSGFAAGRLLALAGHKSHMYAVIQGD